MNYYLVINLGLRSIRAILFDTKAQVIEKKWYPITTYINESQVEQDPREWWSLTERLLGEIFSSQAAYGHKLTAITITSSASCLVAIGSSGEPLMNALMVSDTRAKNETDALKNSPTLAHIFDDKNNIPSPNMMFPKILWMKKHRPALFKRVKYFMNASDFLTYKLSGQVITDTLNAGKYYFNEQKQNYEAAILKYAGINASQLPKVVAPGAVGPKISHHVAQQFSLSKKTYTIISTYDAICAFFGSGVQHEGEASNECGTVSSVRAYSKALLQNAPNLLQQTFDSHYIVGGSNNIDGGLLEWSKTMFYGDSYPEKHVYSIMADEASESPAGANGLVFLPYLIGERYPVLDADIRGIFFGLERFHRRNDLIRSVFEAGSFMVSHMIAQIEDAGLKVSAIRMSGGVTANRIACRIRADITGKKILVIDQSETTALGALFLMFKATGKVAALGDCEQFVKIRETFHPDKKKHALYKKYFQLFTNIYQTNKTLMIERKKLLTSRITKEAFTLENL